jgi:hypothetical protein
VPSDALAKGEPLGCTDVLGQSVQSFRNSGRLSGIHVRWRVIAEGGTRILDAPPSGAESKLKVAAVAAVAADEVVVTVTPTGTSPVRNTGAPGNSDC